MGRIWEAEKEVEVGEGRSEEQIPYIIIDC